MSLRGVIDRLFPLPPLERRRASVIPVKWAGKKLHLDRDADYLTYILFKLMLADYHHDIADDHELFYFTEERIRAYLRGKNLACWCKLDQPCHADVLLELANDEEMT